MARTALTMPILHAHYLNYVGYVILVHHTELLLVLYYSQGEVKNAALVLTPSIGFRALSDESGGKVRVEEKCECRVTYP